MADNVYYTNPSTGSVIGVDTCTVNGVASVGVPLGKAGFGANDTFTYVTSSVGLPGNVVQVGGSAFALGQALAAASLPVVLTAAQLSTLTPPAAITGFALDSTLSTLSGKVTACNTGAVVVASGSVVANAGTNLNTAALALEAGNLATLAGAVTSSKLQANVAQVGGSSLALGQALAAASVPVVLTAAQVTSLTPPAAITGYATDALQGALTETAPATDTASSGLNGRLQRVAQRLTSLIALLPGSLGQKAMAASLPVVLASDQSALSVTPAAGELHLGETGGNVASVLAGTITRPANTTAYAVGGWVNAGSSPAVLTFANVARVASGSGYVASAKLTKSSAVLTNAIFRLHLFNATPTVAAAVDQTAYTMLYADEATHLGWVDFSTFYTEGTGSTAAVSLVVGNNLPLGFTADASKNIYGILVAEAAYVPTSGETFKVRLLADRN